MLQVLEGGAGITAGEMGEDDCLMVVGGVNGVTEGGLRKMEGTIWEPAKKLKGVFRWTETPYKVEMGKIIKLNLRLGFLMTNVKNTNGLLSIYKF